MQPEIDIRIWQNHFQAILGQVEKYDRSQTQAKDDVQCGNSERFIPELDNPIIEQEVRQAIKNLKAGKASGLDNICANVFAEGPCWASAASVCAGTRSGRC